VRQEPFTAPGANSQRARHTVQQGRKPRRAIREVINDAPIFGLQGAVELKPNFHVVGSFGWVPGQNEFVLSRDNVNIYQYPRDDAKSTAGRSASR